MSLLTLSNHTLPAQLPSEDARQYAYRIIKNSILDFSLPPGQKMNEFDFASSLHTSRTPIHDTFIRLSREKLVDIIPQRGAFVAKLDFKRIENALWSHAVLGTDALHSIFIKNVTKGELDILRQDTHQLKTCIEQHMFSPIPPIIYHYYNQLYQLAGDMNYIWESLETIDNDFQRLLVLSINSSDFTKEILYDFTALTNALLQRDCDQACHIYQMHLDKLLESASVLRQHKSEYFTNGRISA